MEEVLFTMALVVSVGVLVMPIYAVVLGVTAKRRIRELGDEVLRLKKSLLALENKATSLATPSPQRESKAAASATAGTTPAAQQPPETDEQEVPERDEPFRKTILTPVQPVAAHTVSDQEGAVDGEEAEAGAEETWADNGSADDAERDGEWAEEEWGDDEEGDNEEADDEEADDEEADDEEADDEEADNAAGENIAARVKDAAGSLAQKSSETAEKSASVAKPTLEEQIGLVWFTRIGAFIGIVVAAWFYKYAVDNDMIGPWGRLAIGAAVGMAALIAGELLQRAAKTHVLFVQGVLGLGLSFLFITSYASAGLYHLIPVSMAFLAIAVLCVLGGALSHRYNSQLILVLSLIAAFLNPILLSTGVDRPIALFSYLLTVTVLVNWFSTPKKYLIAIWLGVVGALVLYSGWYGKYFDVTPERITSMDVLLPGAYAEMSARIAPIVYVLLQTLVWLATATSLTNRAVKATPTVLHLLSSAVMMFGLTGLLYDHPLLLGATVLLLSAGFFVWFHRHQLDQYLVVPLLASFAVMFVGVDRLDASSLPWYLAIGSAVGLLGFGASLRTVGSKNTTMSIAAQVVLNVSAVLFLIFAMTVLLPQYRSVAALFVVMISGLYLIFAGKVQIGWMPIAAVLGSALALGIAKGEQQRVVPLQIGIICAWYVLYVGVSFYDLLKRQLWTASRFAVLVGAAGGFCLLLHQFTRESQDLLRASLCIGAGLGCLLPGTILVRRNAKNDLSMIPFGIAIGFFGIATAYLFSGATMTVAFLMEALALMYVAGRNTGSPEQKSSASYYWLGASAIFAIVGLSHMMSVDMPWLSEQQWNYSQSLGKRGVLVPVPFVNPLGVSLISAIAMFFGGAAFLRRVVHFKRISLVALILGHIFTLWYLSSEIQHLAAAAPRIDVAVSAEEFQGMVSTYWAHYNDEATQRTMIVTCVFGVYALLLLLIGFAKRNALSRIMGISLFGLAIAKLGFWDVWQLETVYRMVVGAIIGATLMISGFLYARFKSRLVGLVKTDAPDDSGKEKTDGKTGNGANAARSIGGLLLLTASQLFCPNAHGFDNTPFEFRAAIEGVSEPGYVSFELPPAFYGATRYPNTLQDVRIVDDSGTVAPYVVRDVVQKVQQSEVRVSPTVLDPVTFEDGSSQVVLDFGESVTPHDGVELKLEGSNFLRQVRVESSMDAKNYGVLAEGGLIYDIYRGSDALRHTDVGYPVSQSRYLRITIFKGSDANVLRVYGAEAIVRPAVQSEVKPFHEVRLKASQKGQKVKDTLGRTIVMLDSPPAQLPCEKLRLDIADNEFERPLWVQRSSDGRRWESAGGGLVYRAMGHASSGWRNEQLEVNIANPESHLRLVFDDKDNAPLKVTQATLFCRRQEIVFRAEKKGPYWLFTGATGSSMPQYDLPSILSRSGHVQPGRVALQKLLPNSHHLNAPLAKNVPVTETYALQIKIGLGILVAVLLFWAVQMLRRKP